MSLVPDDRGREIRSRRQGQAQLTGAETFCLLGEMALGGKEKQCGHIVPPRIPLPCCGNVRFVIYVLIDHRKNKISFILII